MIFAKVRQGPNRYLAFPPHSSVCDPCSCTFLPIVTSSRPNLVELLSIRSKVARTTVMVFIKLCSVCRLRRIYLRDISDLSYVLSGLKMPPEYVP